MTSADSLQVTGTKPKSTMPLAGTHGFELMGVQELPEANTSARLYRHRRTGTELLSLVNDDENKSFGATFRTPVSNSTGVPHILEHLVLRGSRKYPVKDIFQELGKGTLATYQNAFTFPDKTCYPTASQNLKDFYNLVDVYLDTVLYPRLAKLDFQQEGWHQALPSAEEPLHYRGVVFNEMKGNYSDDEWLLYKVKNEGLFPDAGYRHDFAGDPRHIPDLTHEELKSFHRRYYHPSNARLFFYGNDDPEERLRLLDSWLSAFEPQKVDSLPGLQPRLNEPKHLVGTYMADDDQEGGRGRAILTVSWMLDEMADPGARLGLKILEYVLTGTPASPLRRALIDSGLGEALAGAGLEFDFRQPAITFGLKGINPDDADKVEALVLGTLRELATGGIDPLTVGAALNTIEFDLRENNTGRFPRGIALMLRALEGWLYGGDPLSALALIEPLQVIKRRVGAGERFFETLIQHHLMDNQHRVTVLMRPDPEQAGREEGEERQRLDAARAAMSSPVLQATLEATQALKRHEETPDTPEALASVPKLRLDDLPRQGKRIPVDEIKIENARVLCHDLPTNGIVYLDIGFDLHLLPAELLPYAQIFGTALLETGAGKQDVTELSQRIGLATGGISTSASTLTVLNEQRSSPWLFMRAKAVPEKAAELFKIILDVLSGARLGDRDRLRQLVVEAMANRETRLVQAGSWYVHDYLWAGFDEPGWVTEQIDGIQQLFFLRNLAQRIDNDWDNVHRDLERIRSILVNRSTMICNVTAEPAMRARLEQQLASFLADLPSSAAGPAQWLRTPRPSHSGLTVPAKVNYVGKGADLGRFGYKSTGAGLVIDNYLSDTWLYEKIRVQGGAYGGFCSLDRNSSFFAYLSYRDPNVLATLDVYDRTPGFLRDLSLSAGDLDRSIISMIGRVDTYLLPDAKGWDSMIRTLTGETFEVRQRRREEIFAVGAADFRNFADMLDEVADHGDVAVLGGQEAIDAANLARPGFLEVTKVL